MKWDEDDPESVIINMLNASHVTIDKTDPNGEGLITTNYPDVGYIHISGGGNITIRDLKFTKLQTAILQNVALTTNLTLVNLQMGTQGTPADGMAGYGMYIDYSENLTISGCRAYGRGDTVLTEHAFRLYGDNIVVTDCEAYDFYDTELWILDGEGATVDGFIADDRVWIGPNSACDNNNGPDIGQRLKCAVIKNVSCNELHVKLGTLGCWLENIEYGSNFIIGEQPGTDSVARPIDRIHWANVSGPNPVTVHVNDCMGDDIETATPWTCEGDVNRDDSVNVTDLLLIINNWGPCEHWDDPTGGTCEDLGDCITPILCAADIAPAVCGNNAVDVSDLLAVISAWGNCGESGSFPAQLSDCFGELCNSLTGQAYTDCVNKCAEAYCGQTPTPPDCE